MATTLAPLPARMTHNLQFLPLEIQTSIAELRALGTPDHALGLLVDRILKASEAKTTSLQMDIVRIEESITLRLDRMGEKLGADLRTQHGVTNDMLVDIRAATQDQGAAVSALRGEFHHGLQAVGERLTDMEGRADALEKKVAAHDRSRDHSIEERRLLRADMDESKVQRARIQQELTDLSAAVRRVEQLLSIAGDDAAGS